MTEDQAKEKWCPMVRMGAISSHGFNRDSQAGTDYPHYKCVASDCAMWRWVQETYTPDGADPFATVKPLRNSDKGYCGLAGKP